MRRPLDNSAPCQALPDWQRHREQQGRSAEAMRARRTTPQPGVTGSDHSRCGWLPSAGAAAGTVARQRMARCPAAMASTIQHRRMRPARPVAGAWTFGDDQFTNYGHSTVVLDRLCPDSSAQPATAPRLCRARRQAHRRRALATRPYPDQPHPGWKSRQAVPGFRLASGKRSFNLVLGLAAITAGRRASPRES